MNSQTNLLYYCPIKVRPGADCDNSENWVGAIVLCYVTSTDHLIAVKLAASKLAEKGWIFEDLVNQEALELDVDTWDGYVDALSQSIEDIGTFLPSQLEMKQFVDRGGVFVGPYLGWSSKRGTWSIRGLICKCFHLLRRLSRR